MSQSTGQSASARQPDAVFSRLLDELQQRLAGHAYLSERLLLALLCNGHVLIEGAPGLAKTRAVKIFSQLLQTDFSRIQATPDLLPSDLTGSTIYHPQDSSFSFHRGPLFSQIVLVDEINRAPPKVQSALLEAMAERQISVAGDTHRLPDPFLVIATQNPIEHEGTYPLPEAQLDRFLLFVNLSMPDPALERTILDLVLDEQDHPPASIKPLVTPADIHDARRQVSEVFLSPAIRDYIVRLVCATRGHGDSALSADNIEHPISPRGSIFLAQAVKALAWLKQRDHVLPEDVRNLAGDVLSGRMIMTYRALAENLTARQLIRQLLENIPTG